MEYQGLPGRADSGRIQGFGPGTVQFGAKTPKRGIIMRVEMEFVENGAILKLTCPENGKKLETVQTIVFTSKKAFSSYISALWDDNKFKQGLTKAE